MNKDNIYFLKNFVSINKTSKKNISSDKSIKLVDYKKDVSGIIWLNMKPPCMFCNIDNYSKPNDSSTDDDLIA